MTPPEILKEHTIRHDSTNVQHKYFKRQVEVNSGHSPIMYEPPTACEEPAKLK